MNFIKEKMKDFYLLDSKVENIFINEYMPAAPGDFVKVFLYASMYAEHGLDMNNETMAKQLGLTEKKTLEAWDYWEKMGAIKSVIWIVRVTSILLLNLPILKSCYTERTQDRQRARQRKKKETMSLETKR